MILFAICSALANATPIDLTAGAASVGGVSAPALLPAGSTAIYGLVGAPDIGIGYRQGFERIEFEAKVLGNLFELSMLAEAGIKFQLINADRFLLAPGLAVGFKFNSGSRYFDRSNFGYTAVRPRLSLTATYEFSEIVQGLALLEVPWAITFAGGSSQFTPTIGAGAEFHLGGHLSLMATGHFGADAMKEPLGATIVRPAGAIRLGIGYRFF